MGAEEAASAGELGVGVPAPSVFGADEPKLEPDYQAALAALRSPSRLNSGLLLVGSLAAFLLLGKSQGRSVEALAVLVFTLTLHEFGHFIGMKAFGYGDVKMFFIPFLGAAVSGKRAGVDAWKHAVVLLLGPVPGIVLGLVLANRWGSQASALQHTLIVDLVFINAFNLLPLAALDGGRVLENVLFSRHRVLEIGFQVVVVAATFAMALALKSILFGALGYLVALSLPLRWRILKQADRLRSEEGSLPFAASSLTGDSGRRVFLAARGVLLTSAHRPRRVAATMEQLVETVNRKIPSALGTAFPLLGWIGALLLGGAAFLETTRPALRWVQWTAPDGSFSVSLPGRPVEPQVAAPADSATGPAVVMASVGRNLFVTISRAVPPQAPIVPRVGTSTLFQGEPAGESAATLDPSGGSKARPGGVSRKVVVEHSGSQYTLFAFAPADRMLQLDRFFDSFEFHDGR